MSIKLPFADENRHNALAVALSIGLHLCVLVYAEKLLSESRCSERVRSQRTTYAAIIFAQPERPKNLTNIVSSSPRRATVSPGKIKPVVANTPASITLVPDKPETQVTVAESIAHSSKSVETQPEITAGNENESLSEGIFEEKNTIISNAERTKNYPLFQAQPDYVYNPKPVYPMLLREQGIDGIVWLRVWVDANGRPAEINLAKGSGFRLLDESALRAVQQWRFIPARQGQQALASWVEFPIRFKLQG